MAEKKRERYWDIVKGLGIAAVVFGHSGFAYWPVIILINYYHLPIFFFVSGFFYNDKYSTDPYMYIGRKLRTLWWPMIQYVVAFILLHNLFLKLNIYSSLTNQPMIYPKTPYTLFEILGNVLGAILNTSYISEMAGAMWFVLPLFISMVLFCVFQHFALILKLLGIKKEIFTLCLSIIIAAIGVLLMSKTLKLPWRADVAFVTVPIVYSGYFLKKYWQRIHMKWYAALFAVLCVYLSYRQGAELSFFPGLIKNIPAVLAAMFSGIYLNLYVAKSLLKFQFPARVVAYIGKNSFHIMALQFLSFKFINMIDVTIHNKPSFMIAQFTVSNLNWWPLYFFAGLFVPIFFTYTYQQIKNTMSVRNKLRRLSRTHV